MIALPTEAYVAIGKVVVAVGIVLGLFAFGAVLLAAFSALWCWGLSRASMVAWGRFRENDDPPPPVWRIRLAGVLSVLAWFEFSKIQRVYDGAKEVAEESDTATGAFQRYAKKLYSE